MGSDNAKCLCRITGKQVFSGQSEGRNFYLTLTAGIAGAPGPAGATGPAGAPGPPKPGMLGNEGFGAGAPPG